MVIQATKKESALLKCARMILHDQCPPERKYYLCMKEEDDSTCDCTLCWNNYLWGVVSGVIEVPKEEKRAVV